MKLLEEFGEEMGERDETGEREGGGIFECGEEGEEEEMDVEEEEEDDDDDDEEEEEEEEGGS